jgi:hypothetical protein
MIQIFTAEELTDELVPLPHQESQIKQFIEDIKR